MENHFDVIIVGAGAAGLAAAIDLSSAGASVVVLEARDRIGGRILTRQDGNGAPIELGAEFIHGLPPEIWQPLQEHQVPVTEVSGENFCVRQGTLCACDFFSQVDRILGKMDAGLPDESFKQFLDRAFPDSGRDEKLREAKEWATGYVSGFNAADPAEVSVHWLIKEMQADEPIEGERAFRAANGYADVLKIFSAKLNDSRVPIQLNMPVREIRWRQGRVEIAAAQVHPVSAGGNAVRESNNSQSFIAPRALITLPLGVLQSQPPAEGAVRFVPDLPPEKSEALEKMSMGEIVRVTLEFRHRFWEDIHASCAGDSRALSQLSFLFSRDPLFSTWWTCMPDPRPVITAWAPAQSAKQLSGQSEALIVDQALETLSRLLHVPKIELQRLLKCPYFHDWQSDPYSRGAYSYAKVGGAEAPRRLGAPLADTLFFAGEATDVSGHNGTVHGAIASGRRAAAEILRKQKNG